MQTQQTQAQSLYFQSDLTQTQISDILGIDRKTLYNWITKGKWTRTRNTDNLTQTRLIQQYYTQLEKLNMELMGPKKCYGLEYYYDNMRKIATIIKTITPKQTKNQYSAVMYEFITQFQKENPELTNQIKPHIINFITSKDQNFPLEDYFTPFDRPGFSDGGSVPTENPESEDSTALRPSDSALNNVGAQQTSADPTPENNNQTPIPQITLENWQEFANKYIGDLWPEEKTNLTETETHIPESRISTPSETQAANVPLSFDEGRGEAQLPPEDSTALRPSDSAPNNVGAQQPPEETALTFGESGELHEENNINETILKQATEPASALRSIDSDLISPSPSQKNIAPQNAPKTAPPKPQQPPKNDMIKGPERNYTFTPENSPELFRFWREGNPPDDKHKW